MLHSITIGQRKDVKGMVQTGIAKEQKNVRIQANFNKIKVAI
jgi:hypothetical protein